MRDALAFFKTRKLLSAPVLRENGSTLGLLDVSDLVDYAVRMLALIHGGGDAKVLSEQYFNRPVGELLSLFSHAGISLLPLAH